MRRTTVGLIAAGIVLSLFVPPALAAAVIRGPYLQMSSDTAVTVRWRTDVPTTDALVRYGDAPSNLSDSVSGSADRTEHEVRVSGLNPDTRYYYSVGTSAETLAGGDSTHFFTTSPVTGTGKPTRVWVIGDSGTADANASAVYNAYRGYTGGRGTDLWLMLGDNAYNDGTDGQYQNAVFDMYPEMLRNTTLWPTLGNHDGYSADSATESGPYYDIFTLPRSAEAGGLASRTEAYYSFDYGDVHFICLDSYDSDRSPDGAMMNWLENDLAATSQPWIIAFWHHPPYSKGSHNSDTESNLIQMRENALPILEAYGADLVLGGHSHSYERSVLLDGHYGNSGTLTQEMILDAGSGREDDTGAYQKPVSTPHAGTVYTVAGSSGKTSGGALNHPVMFLSLNELGSVVIDVDGNRLDATFLKADGSVRDYYSLIKGDDTSPPVLFSADAVSGTGVILAFSEKLEAVSAGTAGNYAIDGSVSVQQASLAADERSVLLVTSSLTEGVPYRVTVNAVRDLAGNAVAPDSQASFTYKVQRTDSFQDGAAPTPDYAGTRDAYISENAPNTNYGAAAELLADGDDPGGTGRDLSSLLRFDVSSIPSEAVVEGVSLEISVFNVSGNSYSFYPLIRAWDESAVTWNRASAGIDWGRPGAMDDESDRDGTLVGEVSAPATGLATISLNADGVAMVQGWVDDSQSNHGFILAGAGNTDGLDFYSSEAATATGRPRLNVTYWIPPSGGDTEPPTVPAGLHATGIDEADVALAWQAATDNLGVTGYRLYRDGQLIGSTAATDYSDSGLTPDTTYEYSVEATDAAGNLSGLSAPLQVTTLAPPPAPAMHVADVTMSLVPVGRKWVSAQASVIVNDVDAQPVANATVSGNWSGLVNGEASGPTGADGRVVLLSPKVGNQASGELRLTVTDVSAADFDYDAGANVESGDCILTDGTQCEGGGGPVSYYVDSLEVSVLPSRKLWLAEVAVKAGDGAGSPASGALVEGAWQLNGAAIGIASGTTDDQGMVTIQSPKQRASSGDTFTFIVTNAEDGQTTGSAAVP